jgi:hypothetical protein
MPRARQQLAVLVLSHFFSAFFYDTTQLTTSPRGYLTHSRLNFLL